MLSGSVLGAGVQTTGSPPAEGLQSRGHWQGRARNCSLNQSLTALWEQKGEDTHFSGEYDGFKEAGVFEFNLEE